MATRDIKSKLQGTEDSEWKLEYELLNIEESFAMLRIINMDCASCKHPGDKKKIPLQI